jgi:hypothetical protein
LQVKAALSAGADARYRYFAVLGVAERGKSLRDKEGCGGAAQFHEITSAYLLFHGHSSQ